MHSNAANSRNCTIYWNTIHSHRTITTNCNSFGWKHIMSRRKSYAAVHWALLVNTVYDGNSHCLIPFGMVSNRVICSISVRKWHKDDFIDSLHSIYFSYSSFRWRNQLLFQRKIPFDFAWLVCTQSISIATRETRTRRWYWSHNNAGNIHMMHTFHLSSLDFCWRRFEIGCDRVFIYTSSVWLISDLELVQKSTAKGSGSRTQRVSIHFDDMFLMRILISKFVSLIFVVVFIYIFRSDDIRI